MMRFLCAVYLEPEAVDTLSPSEKLTLDRNCMDYDEQLRQSGHLIAADALEPVRSARTIRVRQGKTSTVDGPFAETKEHLGGFILIEARDMNEALKIAEEAPIAKVGSIEVRPSMQLKR